jgi:hypothetical protein
MHDEAEKDRRPRCAATRATDEGILVAAGMKVFSVW